MPNTLSPWLAKLTSVFMLLPIRLLTGTQARLQGCAPKADQRIYFANHLRHTDLARMWAALPAELRSFTRPIAARDYRAQTPFRKWLARAVFNATCKERDKTGDQTPLQPLVSALEQDDSVISFSSIRVAGQVLMIRRVGIAHVPARKLLQTEVTWAMPTLQEAEQLSIRLNFGLQINKNGRKLLFNL